MSLRHWLIPAAALVAAGGAVAWWLTAPDPIDPSEVAGWSPSPEAAARGERLFHLGSCVSCHAAPGAEGEATLALAGGRAFPTEFGTFHAPNISQDPDAGIGAWTPDQFASAFLRGVGARGEHLYPAFPWPSYSRMELSDALDLWAYLKTLPADPTPSKPHDVGFPFSIRAAIGGWKLLYLKPEPVIAGLSGEAEAGRRLVEGIGHCGECHTPRDALGGPDYAAWLGGGPNPDGEGRIPNITPSSAGIGDWSASDIAYYLESGFTPDYDSAGGGMAAVVAETAKLPPEDRAAIAAYLKAVPPVE
ncbi:cytochrome c [Albimonas sp. CAU 1670]|uniref:c-type cytochrome n=1 Tax=Albimonas sp. CAU 1670 TaxID=3032599 RepID=UPI0023DAEF7B|nr:cytochrome c [Albimonas sp. CAU 1670]MDF2232872.1 cytochrome c [Albimonas sp. CAU 1670]